jgi:uncharacterized LabA/DUF88 family protein
MFMSNRVYTYVDGESHFIRCKRAWGDIHGQAASLEQLRHKADPAGHSLLCVPDANVLWMTQMAPDADRIYYFTSISGDTSCVHRVKCHLRDHGLEPEVVHETSQLKRRRQAAREQDCLIEKPKGVDIALAVCMLESRRHFEVCHLFTSDIDYLPVVKALRADGKLVYVHGFEDGLGQESDFLHACDGFIDLTEILQEDCFAADDTSSWSK